MHVSPQSMYPTDDSASTLAPPSARFGHVRLTAERLDAFHDMAHSALSRTVSDFVQLDGKPIDTARWRHVRSRGGASVFYERRCADKHQVQLLVAGTMKARLSDVMEGLYMDSTETTRLVQHQLNARFIDAEVLKVIETRSAAQPFAFTGLKWAMVKATSSGIVANRDICYLEKLGVIDIAGGRKLGYFIMQSVDLPECLPSASAKIIRAAVSLCYLFEETRNGLVGIYMTGTMLRNGPKMLYNVMRTNFADIALSVSTATEVAYAKRCLALIQAKQRLPPPKQARSSVCEICHSLPSFFERHRECAGCEKMSVCKKCVVRRDVLCRETHASSRLARASFCFHCNERVRNPHAPLSTPRFYSDPEYDQDDSRPKSAFTHATPRGRFKPLYDDDSPRGFRRFDDIDSPPHYKHGQRSTASTFKTDHDEYDEFDEPEPDSERSLRMFTLKLQQQLEEIGFDELDSNTRHNGLVLLGSGEFDHDTDSVRDDSDDGESVLSKSVFSSSATSFRSVESDGAVRHSRYGREEPDDDDELIMSVRPVRRSVQPPEMLEAQTLNPDGSLRKQSNASYKVSAAPDDVTRALLTRLEEASLVAEQTYEQLKRAQALSRSRTSSRAMSTESYTS